MSSLITEVDILQESKDCFLAYTEEVLTDRAVPSAEDGLLSVHRKLLWTMEEVLKMDSNTKYKKSASVVGTTLSTSYFHGDTACYGALCKITQPYLMRYPLVDGDGNFGTQEGNGMEAAARYTNCRPSIYADLMMTQFKKNIVPLKETYNGEYYEPVVLPSLLPNAMVNGRETIAVGLAHSSLPHNLTEVCNAILARIKKGSALTTDELMQYIKGPDFPLENTVINSRDIRTAFETGHSATSLKVRGKYTIDKDTITFTTIPYRTYRNKIKEQINKNIDVLENYIEDFSDISNVGKNCLVFKVKSGVTPESAVAKLFECTDLQTTLSYNMNFIVNGTPKMCSMSALVDAYVAHQDRIMVKATEYDRDKAEARKHILDGMLVVIEDIDKAIEIIRGSYDRAQAEAGLIEYFKLDKVQAKAVLDMKLAKLTKLDKDALLKELEEQKQILIECNKILNDVAYRGTKLAEMVTALRDKYGDARRTELIDVEVPKKVSTKAAAAKVDIIPEDVVITMTENGTLKRTAKSSYRVQRRGGKGVKSSGDALLGVLKTNTTDMLCLFSNLGKMYRVPVHKIEAGKGVSITNFITLEPAESIVNFTSLRSKSCPKYILFFTEKGMLKKGVLEEYMNTNRNSGIKVIKLKAEDKVIKVVFQDEEDVVLLSKNGLGLRLETKDITTTSKIAGGVIGMKLDKDDKLVTALPVHKTTDKLALFSFEGLGKKMELSEIPVQGRNTKGIMTGMTKLVGGLMISDEDSVMAIGTPNTICIEAKSITLQSKKGSGTKIIGDGSINYVTKI
jgi:DNA gyrase subunit A